MSAYSAGSIGPVRLELNEAQGALRNSRKGPRRTSGAQ